jgi:cysteine desulfurase/selenocysteine lyase
MTTSHDPAISQEEIRAQFPTLSEGLYLNHAAVAPWPQCTSDAVIAFATENAKAGPAAYRDWIEREKSLRQKLRMLTGAASEQDIALLKNTTEGISVVAWGLDWQAGDNIVIPAGEFPSNRLPWLAQATQGVTVREVDIRRTDDAEKALLDSMDAGTRLLSVSAVQWNDGFRLDLGRLGKACKAAGVLFFVDAIQQLGALPLDVEACHIDFLAADAHKWLLGPEGIAVFYCRDSVRPRLRLHQEGWHMYDNPWNFGKQAPAPAQGARRFEAGSPNSLGQSALHASLDLILSIGMEKVSKQVLNNTDFMIRELTGLGRLKIDSPSALERRSGIVSCSHSKLSSRQLHKNLTENGITSAVRGDSVRLSPHFYQHEADLSRLVSVMERLED